MEYEDILTKYNNLKINLSEQVQIFMNSPTQIILNGINDVSEKIIMFSDKIDKYLLNS